MLFKVPLGQYRRQHADITDDDDSSICEDDDGLFHQVCSISISFSPNAPFALLETTKYLAVQYCSIYKSDPSRFAQAAQDFADAVMGTPNISSASAETSLSYELNKKDAAEAKNCYQERKKRDYWSALRIQWDVSFNHQRWGMRTVTITAIFKPRWERGVLFKFKKPKSKSKFALLCMQHTLSLMEVVTQMKSAAGAVKDDSDGGTKDFHVSAPTVARNAKTSASKSDNITSKKPTIKKSQRTAPKAFHVRSYTKGSNDACPPKRITKYARNSFISRSPESSPEPVLQHPLPSSNHALKNTTRKRKIIFEDSDYSDAAEYQATASNSRPRKAVKVAARQESNSIDLEPTVSARTSKAYFCRKTASPSGHVTAKKEQRPAATKARSLLARQVSPSPSLHDNETDSDDEVPLRRLQALPHKNAVKNNASTAVTPALATQYDTGISNNTDCPMDIDDLCPIEPLSTDPGFDHEADFHALDDTDAAVPRTVQVPLSNPFAGDPPHFQQHVTCALPPIVDKTEPHDMDTDLQQRTARLRIASCMVGAGVFASAGWLAFQWM